MMHAADLGKFIIRVNLGVLVLFHGIAKLNQGVGGIANMLENVGLPGFFAYGVFLGEVVGPLLLIAGFYSRIGAGLIVANMVVALLLAHRGEFFQLTQQGGYALELQFMFLFTAIGLMLTGAGRLAFRSRWN